MHKNDQEFHIAQQRARDSALIIAAHAGWEMDPSSLVLLPRGFQHFIYVPDNELLLAPSASEHRNDLEFVSQAMRYARADAMIVDLPDANPASLTCAIGLWSPEKFVWHRQLKLWLSPQDEGWLVQRPANTIISVEAFRLASGRLRPSAGPIVISGSGFDAGLARANDLLRIGHRPKKQDRSTPDHF